MYQFLCPLSSQSGNWLPLVTKCPCYTLLYLMLSNLSKVNANADSSDDGVNITIISANVSVHAFIDQPFWALVAIEN